MSSDLRPHRLNAPDAPHGVSEKLARLGEVEGTSEVKPGKHLSAEDVWELHRDSVQDGDAVGPQERDRGGYVLHRVRSFGREARWVLPLSLRR